MNENNKPKMHNFKYIGGKKIYYAADNYCMYGLSHVAIYFWYKT